MLNDLILKEDETPEISFDLQVSGDGSVPDAVISQKSFKIVVETKLYNQFDKGQLLRHLSQFSNEEIKVLMTLDPRPMKKDFLEEFEKELKLYNEAHRGTGKTLIRHVNLTFEQLLDAMEKIIDERESEILAVLDDFKKYCFEEGLIPDGYKWMRAVGKLVKTVIAGYEEGRFFCRNESGEASNESDRDLNKKRWGDF